MWVNMQGPLLHDFSGLPQVKNQHLTVLNKRRRLEWCTSMLQGWLVSTTTQCSTVQSSFNHRVPQICLPQTSFCRTNSKYSSLSIQLLPIPRNCGLFVTRVYHRTWAGSREMFEKIGNAWVHRLKPCVAAKGGYCEQ